MLALNLGCAVVCGWLSHVRFKKGENVRAWFDLVLSAANAGCVLHALFG